MNKKSLLNVLLFAAVFYLILTTFAPKQKAVDPNVPIVPLAVTVSDSFVEGTEVKVTLKNNMLAAVTLPSNCPGTPLKVTKFNGTAFVETKAEILPSLCEGVTDVTLAPQAEQTVSYKMWNHALFGQPGKYKFEVGYKDAAGKDAVATSTEFEIEEAGVFRQFFRTTFYRPLYNGLMGLLSIAPYHDLGFAIIVLTLLVRLALLVPSQHAIVSQRRLQELQPKLDSIKKEFAGNQERIASETMKLWKQHKVNPFGSCLPLLIQFPVLIAIYYVIQDGLNPDNAYMLYEPLKNFDFLNIHTYFLGILDLRKANMYVLPVIIGLLQFAQMKLTLGRRKKPGKHVDDKAPKNEMEMANKTMVYIMPVMIAVFTASLPAGVGLYWGISTLFAIGQQLVANKKVAATT